MARTQVGGENPQLAEPFILVPKMQSNATPEVVERLGDLREPLALDKGRDTAEHPPEPVLDPACKRILVGIPLKGHTPPASYHDRMLMWKFLGDKECQEFYEKKNPRYSFFLACIGELLVPYARERFAETALELQCDYLFMVDDDMLAPPSLFYELVASDKDIVAPLAFTRNPDHQPVMYSVEEGFDPATHQPYYINHFVKNYPRNQLVQCDAVGFGAVLIKAEVLRHMKTPRFMGLQGAGEDVTFCYKAKQLGFEVWMDTRIKLGHLGAATIITEEYSDQWHKLSLEEREKTYGKYQKYQTEVMR